MQIDETRAPEAALERRGLRDRVHDRILAHLLGSEVVPGARLSIDTLARTLDVSPTPVREALVQLERTGLIEREPHKGYRVAGLLQPAQLAELLEARSMLESAAIVLAGRDAERLLRDTREALVAHREMGAQMIAGMQDGGTPSADVRSRYFAADAGFHNVIFRACGNRYIIEMANGMGAQLHRFRQSVVHGVTDVREAIEEHSRIVDAIAGGDVDAMEAAMRRHIDNVRSRSLSEGH